MKKHFMRFALCFGLIVTAFLSYTVMPDKTEIEPVKAQGSYGPVEVLDTQYSGYSYEDYVSLFAENWTWYLHTFDEDWANDGGEITNVTLYEKWNDEWEMVWDTQDTPWDTSDDSPCQLGVMTPDYEYAVKFKFSAGGDYMSGESSIIPFSILPCSVSHNFDANNFTGVYNDMDNWFFTQGFYFTKQSNPFTHVEDDVEIVWCYDIGDEPFELDNDSDAGTYYIYPVLKGAQKSRYELDLTYSDPMTGISNETISKENPVACTITKRDIKVVVSYCGVNLSMYDDGASEIINTIRANGVLPLVAYCPEYNVKVNIDWFRNATTYEQELNGISKLGTYFATSAAFTCVEAETYLNPDNFTIVDSNIKITIAKRYIQIDGAMNSKYCYAPSYPDYSVVVKLDSFLGETEENVVVPKLHFDTNSTIPTGYLENGHAILVLDDTDSYLIEIMGGMDYDTSIEWDYMVTEGDAHIEATQIRPWYYGEILEDIEDIFEFNVYTDDPEETVEIYSIEWTMEAFPNEYTIWHNIVVNGSDPESGFPQKWALDSLYLLEYGLNIRVTTDYSSGGKYTMTSKVFHVNYAKAPVYIRVVDEALVFNNEDQAPSWDSYRFYIFEPGKAENLWDTASVYVDIADFVEYYYDSTLDEMVPHVWGTNNSDAGKYSLLVVLTEQALQRYELIENEWGAFTYGEEIVDPDSYYVIYKKGLSVGSMTIDTMTYGQEPINYYLLDYKPTISGFVEGDYSTEKTSENWYFNTTSLYASDEEWLPIDEMPAYPYVNVGTYYIKYVATYDNYQDAVATAQLKVIAKELTILWYADEESVDLVDGIDTENDTTLNIANYVYDGTVHKPHYEISGYYYFDIPTVTESKISRNDLDYGDGIKVGKYFYILSALSSENYIWPHRYSSCMALYTVYPRTIYIAPDQGLSTVYFDDDPELTYTYSNNVPGEEITFVGSLSRESGMTVGTYEIYLGSLALADTATNANYTILLSAEDYYTFAVTPRDITANFSVVSKVYTSANITPDFSSFTGLLGNDDVTIQYTTESVDVGEYDKGFKIVGDDAFNYALTETTVKLTITQATLDFTAVLDTTNATLSVEYDGNEHVLTVTPTGIKVNDEGRIAIVINENDTGTTAQTYTATLSLTGDKAANYKLARTSVIWYITPKGVDMSQFKNAFADNTVTYDGTAYTIKTLGSIPAHYTYKFYLDSVAFDGAINVGSYNVEIRFTSDDTTNYPNVQSIYNTLTINQREVTVEFGKADFVYDGTNHLPTVTLKNIASVDDGKVVATLNTDGAINKSTTIVSVTGLYIDKEVAANYKLTGTTQVTMIISAREITVKALDKTSVYGETPVELTAEVTEGEIIEGDTDVYTLSCTVTNKSIVRDDYTIKVNKGTNKNYDVTTVDGTYEVTKRAVKFTIANQSSYYGDSRATLTASIAEGTVVNNDGVIYELNCDITKTTDADEYTITGKGTNSNYDVTFVNGTYTVNPRQITVTVSDLTSVYGEDPKAVKVEATNVVNNDIPYSVSHSVEKLSPVATYNFTYSKTSENYVIDWVVGTYTVTQRPITVAILDKTSVYGDSRVKLTHEHIKGSYAGNDIASDVFELVCNVNSTTVVGKYDITGNTINNNYVVTYIGGTADDPDYTVNHGTYTITKRAITVTVDAKTSVYGENAVALTGVVTSETQVVNGDTPYSFTSDATTPFQGQGSYNIIGHIDNNNYVVTFLNEENAYTITRREITVTIYDLSSVYGDPVAGVSHNVTSETKIVNNDENVYSVSYDVSVTSSVGTYDIVGTANDINYLITFVNAEGTSDKAVYTITKREITVTIYDKTSVYGDMTAELTHSVTSENKIVNNDENVYAISCEVTNKSNVGTYDIVGEILNENYDITFTSEDETADHGTYTITVRPITVTFDAQTSVYGEARVELTREIASGQIVNDDINVYDVECVVDNTTAVGVYDITGTIGTNANYTIEFINAKYTVTVREITVTIDNQASVYGDQTAELTSKVTSDAKIVNEDENVYGVTCEATALSNVGEYAITGVEGTNTNYHVTFVPGVYTINQRIVTLTWSADVWTYDENAHKPVATAGNIVNNDRVEVTVEGEKVEAGTYTATAVALSNTNYALPMGTTHQFVINKSAGYAKELNTEDVATNGIDLTQIFDNIDTESQDTVFTVTVGESTITFNKAAIDAIAENENVNLTFKFVEGEEGKAIYKKAAAVFEISLDGVTFENGTVTIKTAYENKAPFGKVAKLYYVNANGKTVDMKAVFEDGYITFETNHFSTFAVVYKLSTLSIILIILLVLAAAGAVVYFVVLNPNKKGNTPKAPKAPANNKPADVSDAEDNTPANE